MSRKIKFSIGNHIYEGESNGNLLMLIENEIYGSDFDQPNPSDSQEILLNINTTEKIKGIHIFNNETCIFSSEKSSKTYKIDLPVAILNQWILNLNNLRIYILLNHGHIECFFPSSINQTGSTLESVNFDCAINIDSQDIEFNNKSLKFKLNIIGWVFDKEDEESDIKISLVANNKVIGNALNILNRQDVKDALGIKLNKCGFNIGGYTPSLDSVHLRLEKGGKSKTINLEINRDNLNKSKKNDVVILNENKAPNLAVRLNKSPVKNIKLSIIVLTRLAHNLCLPLLQKIKVDCPNDELIVVCHNLSENDENLVRIIADKTVLVSGNFNWSKFNNLASKVSSCDYLLYINDDIYPATTDWRRLLSSSLTPKNIVGAQLISRELKLQHAGIGILGKCSITLDTPSENINAVTGAFMAINKKLFTNLQMFNEKFALTFNDVEFCLRARAGGIESTVPGGLLFYHFESSTRHSIADDSVSTNEYISQAILNYGEPELINELHSSTSKNEPIEILQHTSFNPTKIAAIKVDHIGDFFSCINSFIRLKELYPKAQLTLICSPEVSNYARGLNIFDKIIAFRSFNKISELGKSKNDPDTFDDKFDLALDFRKHDDARKLLTKIESKYKFSMTQSGSADELEMQAASIKPFSCHNESKELFIKNSVWQESLAFVEYVHTHMSSIVEAFKIEEASFSPIKVKEILIFPFSGNSSREWPLELYIRLAKTIRSNHPSLNIKICPDESNHWRLSPFLDLFSRESIDIFVANNLEELTSKINKKSSLIICNNSGPSWIASHLKIPFISIMSGVVENSHWLPPGGVGVTRAVSCSPCYIERPDSCHRQMYCINSISPKFIHNLIKKMMLN